MRLRFLKHLLLSPTPNEGGDGGEPQLTPEASQAIAALGQGEGFDDFGYPVVQAPAQATPPAPQGGTGATPPAPPAPPAPNGGTPPPPPPPPKIEGTTGYQLEPDKPATPPPPPPPPPATDVDLGYEVNSDGLPSEVANEMKQFFKTHSIPKETAQAFLDQRKVQLSQAESARVKAENEATAAREKTRMDWHSELRNDPTFGGENFAHSIHQAEKFIAEFIPELKQKLTDSKGMLPPYVMRGLAKAANTMFATPSLVQGDPSKPVEDDDYDDPTSFYNTKSK